MTATQEEALDERLKWTVSGTVIADHLTRTKNKTAVPTTSLYTAPSLWPNELVQPGIITQWRGF